MAPIATTDEDDARRRLSARRKGARHLKHTLLFPLQHRLALRKSWSWQLRCRHYGSPLYRRCGLRGHKVPFRWLWRRRWRVRRQIHSLLTSCQRQHRGASHNIFKYSHNHYLSDNNAISRSQSADSAPFNLLLILYFIFDTATGSLLTNSAMARFENPAKEYNATR